MPALPASAQTWASIPNEVVMAPAKPEPDFVGLLAALVAALLLDRPLGQRVRLEALVGDRLAALD
jgi:hypothetical protein